MSMTRDHGLYFVYTCDYLAIALCGIYKINQHSYYYWKQWTYFSVYVVFFSLYGTCNGSGYEEEEDYQDYPDT
jgi:hypothetical protein